MVLKMMSMMIDYDHEDKHNIDQPDLRKQLHHCRPVYFSPLGHLPSPTRPVVIVILKKIPVSFLNMAKAVKEYIPKKIK